MSEINPYAAPAGPVELPLRTGDPGDGSPQGWEIGEVIGSAWGIFKRDWPVLVGSLVVGYAIMALGQFLFGTMLGVSFIPSPEGDSTPAKRQLVSILAFLLNTFVMLGWTRIWLASARGETPSFGLLFSGGARYATALGALVLTYLATAVGILGLIVGAIVVALGLSMVTFYVADTQLGVIDSLKASWEAMRGNKLKMLGFGLAALGLNVGGMLACGLGLLVTANITFVATAIIYTRVSGRLAPSAA